MDRGPSLHHPGTPVPCPSPQGPPPIGPNMFRPITPAPTFSRDSLTTRALSFTSPPGLPWASRHSASGTPQSWSRSPPSPSGFSSLWFGPATNPSSEIEIWHLSLLIAPPGTGSRPAPRSHRHTLDERP